MIDKETGAWIECEEYQIYERETAYYIKYDIRKALYAMVNIYSKSNDFELQRFENKEDYYQIQIDILLDSLGKICDRLKIHQRTNEKYLDIKIILNQNYLFEDSNYPILYRKDIRNFKTHIHERNLDIIIKENKIGKFVLLDEEAELEKRKVISNRKVYNNILDLLNKKYLISYFSNEKLTFDELDLGLLSEELFKLNERNDYILELIQGFY